MIRADSLTNDLDVEGEYMTEQAMIDLGWSEFFNWNLFFWKLDPLRYSITINTVMDITQCNWKISRGLLAPRLKIKAVKEEARKNPRTLMRP